VEPALADRTPHTNRPIVPARLLVGLASDRESVDIEVDEESVRMFNAGEHFVLSGTATVSAWSIDGDGAAVPSRFYIQASALKDQRQAEALAARLGVVLSRKAAAVFDAQTDLYKVRVGPLSDRARAEALKPELVKLGYKNPFIVREANLDSISGFDVEFRRGSEVMMVRFAGRYLLVERESQMVFFDKQAYRGRLLLFISDRGKINVINDIALEDYLRGVVPRELGPDLYPELEALKAQAIAARTYTVKNLGEFLEEGYDICSTPRCQVYGGMAAEHPLSDRAIRETAGEVLITKDTTGATEVEIVDAMFSASCGGHTENVGSVFPLKSEPYLVARACIEAGTTRLSSAPRSLLESVMDGLRGKERAETEDRRTRLASDLQALANAAGIATPVEKLASLSIGEVKRYLASLFDLFLDRRWLDPGSRAPADLLRGPTQNRLTEVLEELASLPSTTVLTPQQQGGLVVGMAEALGVLTFERVRFGSYRGAKVRVHSAGDGKELVLSQVPSLFLQDGETSVPVSSLVTFAGDVLDLAVARGVNVALLGSSDVRRGPSPVRAQSWHRFRSRARLRELVAERYPGFTVDSIRSLSTGPSGRVERLALIGKGGREEVVEGLAIRWILDLPDTWFRVEKGRRGVDGWEFIGRGRGHGVGMCQVGAYGMAIMGVGYRDILAHYYSGTEVVDSEVDAERLPWTRSVRTTQVTTDLSAGSQTSKN